MRSGSISGLSLGKREQIEEMLDHFGTDIAALPRYWRDLANVTSMEQAETFRMCALQLQIAWHNHAHDAEWDSACVICKVEQTRQ
jgi:hypothetical protein